MSKQLVLKINGYWFMKFEEWAGFRLEVFVWELGIFWYDFGVDAS